MKVLNFDILQDMLMSYSLVDLTRRKKQYVIQAKIEKSEIEKAVFVKTQCNVEAEVEGKIETTTAEKMKAEETIAIILIEAITVKAEGA